MSITQLRVFVTKLLSSSVSYEVITSECNSVQEIIVPVASYYHPVFSTATVKHIASTIDMYDQ